MITPFVNALVRHLLRHISPHKKGSPSGGGIPRSQFLEKVVMTGAASAAPGEGQACYSCFWRDLADRYHFNYNERWRSKIWNRSFKPWSLSESLSGRERMPKLKKLLIAVAAAMLSTSAALTDTKADDRSYLPPQDLQDQAKESGVQAAPQAEPGLRNKQYGTPPRYMRRHYAQRHTRRHFFPGIFFSLFR